MGANAARDEFVVRSYRWALEDARREVRENLRFLRRIKGALAMRAVGHLESLSPIEQIELLTAMIKRFHPRAVEVTGEALTAREKALLQTKDQAVRVPTPFEVSLSETRSPTDKRGRLNRSRLTNLAKSELAPLLGLVSPLTRQVLRFTTTMAGWNLLTIVGCANPPYYFHAIRADAAASLQESVSLLSWLGVASQTTWELTTAGDEHETVGSIACVCSHFVRALPGLLTDLSA